MNQGQNRSQPPLPGWVMLPQAHLYYRRGSFLHSIEDWHRHVENVVESFAEEDGGEYPEAFRVGRVGDDRSLDVRAFRMDLTISPKTGRFSLAPEAIENGDQNEIEDLLGLSGEAPAFLRKCHAYRGPTHLAVGVDWHRRLVEYLVRVQQDALTAAIDCGAAHVMARKNDIMAPFERVMPDQLGYFTFEGGNANRAAPDAWRGILDGSDHIVSAAGPDNVRLYSIHIAPGVALSDGKTPLEKCRDWIRQLAVENPDARPFPKREMLVLAREKCGGDETTISVRSFDRMLQRHQPETWRRPGRPRNP